MWWCIGMGMQQFACCSRCQLPLDLLSIEVEFLEDAVNELGLCQVDVSMLVSLDVDSKEIGNGSLDCDLESRCFHVLYHPQKFSMLWAGEE